MNKQLFPFLLTLLMSMVGTNSFAHDIAVANSDGVTIYYVWTNNNSELAVSYRGDTPTSYSDEYSGDIKIPELVDYNGRQYRVTSIAQSAFEGCTNVVSVSFPYNYNTMKIIGNSAFEGCTGLASVEIPDGVTTIGNGAFWQCSSLKSVAIPGAVTSIGEGAFKNCYNLESVLIPGSVTSIGNSAFGNCNNLTQVISLIQNPFTINNNVFTTYSTTTLVIPKGTKSTYQAISGWKNFTNIYDGYSADPTKRTIHVATAGTLSYFISEDDMYNVEELTLSGELNGSDIYFIRKMAGIDFSVHEDHYNGGAYYSSTEGMLKILDISDSKIVKGGIAYMATDDTFDSSGITITDLNWYYFYTNDNTISDLMFYGTKLESIVLPNSITSIESGAFRCPLTSIIIPKSVVNISSGVFSRCNSLTSIVVESGNTIYDSRNNCNAIIESNSDKLIAGCKNTSIPNNVTSIENMAFSYCSGLTSITIPNNVTSIGEGAFYNCSGLTSITISNNVTTIGSYAFSGCRALASITIGKSVTSIGNLAFSDCGGLTTIVSEVENPFAINDNTFYNYDKDIYSTATLIVPPGKKDAYQNTAGWSKFTNIDEAELIGYEFEDNGIRYKIRDNNTVSVAKTEDLSGDIVIPNKVPYDGVLYTVTSIEDYAFCFCTITSGSGGTIYDDYSMTSITIPSSIKSIGEDAFAGRVGLNAVYITDLKAWCNIIFNGEESNPLYWAQHLYLNGEEIKDLVIPNGVNSISSDAFMRCSGLTSVTIPNSVTSIGSYAFGHCSGLTTIVSKIENPFAIDDKAFNCYDKDIYATATLIVPPGKKSAYQNTAGWSKFTNIVEAELIGYEFEADGIRYKIRDNNTVSVVPRDAKYTGDIVIPNQVAYNGVTYSVTTIGDSAFDGCADVTSVTIPNGVTIIEDGGFYYCSGLKSINIPDGVTTIGLGAFSGCSSLTSITIPSSVTSIGKYAFDKCTSLSRIVSERVQPIAIDKSVFDTYNDPHNVYTMATLVVPSGSKSAYQNTSGWKKFTNIVEEQKCAKPTITYNNGKISFSCETEGVEFHYTISNANSSTGVGSSVSFTPTVSISVYASKSGYANSSTSTAEIEGPAGLRGDLNNDGTVNVADHVELTNIIMGQ